MPSKIPFSLVTTFSNHSFGGNPAGVVFIDPSLPSDTLSSIAKNLAQPATAFVAPVPSPSDDETVLKFNIRWFSAKGVEILLCGHGTVAAAQVIFGRQDLASEKVNTIEFKTLLRGVVKAVKLEGGLLELALPSSVPQAVSAEERARLIPFLVKAFGRDVAVKHVADGGEIFKNYLLVELDKKEDLGASVVTPEALRGNGYFVNVFTTESMTGNELFISRMFSPDMLPGGEDHVCGSAHCILGPYWYQKHGINTGAEVNATQVSPRGGGIGLIWDENKNVIRLKGQVVVFGSGELYF